MEPQPDSAPKNFSSRRSVMGTTVIRCGLAGALTMALVFTVAWAAAQLPYGPTPLFIEIFTHASPATMEALFEGVLIAALAGFIAAAVLSVAYGAFEFVERLGTSSEDPDFDGSTEPRRCSHSATAQQTIAQAEPTHQPASTSLG